MCGKAVKIMAMNTGYLTSDRTNRGDEYYTPFYAVEPMLEFLPENPVVWCPFDEEWSAFFRLLTERGFRTVRSSLKEHQDFFSYEPENWDILVSNPPFSRKDEVLKRAFSFNKPFALLLPVDSIQGKKRFEIFNNEVQMLVFDGRVNYHTRENMNRTKSGISFGSAYFCRNLLPSKLEMRKLKEYQRPLIGGDEKWE